MDLLNKLNQEAQNLWQKLMNTKDQHKREAIMKLYREAYGRYSKHKEWLKAMEAQ